MQAFDLPPADFTRTATSTTTDRDEFPVAPGDCFALPSLPSLVNDGFLNNPAQGLPNSDNPAQMNMPMNNTQMNNGGQNMNQQHNTNPNNNNSNQPTPSNQTYYNNGGQNGQNMFNNNAQNGQNNSGDPMSTIMNNSMMIAQNSALLSAFNGNDSDFAKEFLGDNLSGILGDNQSQQNGMNQNPQQMAQNQNVNGMNGPASNNNFQNNGPQQQNNGGPQQQQQFQQQMNQNGQGQQFPGNFNNSMAPNQAPQQHNNFLNNNQQQQQYGGNNMQNNMNQQQMQNGQNPHQMPNGQNQHQQFQNNGPGPQGGPHHHHNNQNQNNQGPNNNLQGVSQNGPNNAMPPLGNMPNPLDFLNNPLAPLLLNNPLLRAGGLPPPQQLQDALKIAGSLGAGFPGPLGGKGGGLLPGLQGNKLLQELMYSRLQAELQAQVGRGGIQELLNNAVKLGRGGMQGRGGGKNGGLPGGRAGGDFTTRGQGGKRGFGGLNTQQGGGYIKRNENGRNGAQNLRGGRPQDTLNPKESYNYDREPVRSDPVMEQLFATGEYLTSGRLLEVSKDQLGCRLMQGKLTELQSDEEHLKTIFDAILPEGHMLMTHAFGNYLCQRIFEIIEHQSKPELLDRFVEQLLEQRAFLGICVDSYGTRAMQKLLDAVTAIGTPSTFEKVKFAASTENVMVSLIEDLNGNHVCQKLIRMFDDKSFIFDRLSEHLVQLSCHKHGCCVLQRCYDVANSQQRSQLQDGIIHHCAVLIQDPFGNYVVQHVMQEANDPSGFISNIVDVVLPSFVSLCCQKFSSNVIEQCLEFADRNGRARLVNEILSGETVQTLFRDRYGNYVLQRALAVSEQDGPIFYDIINKLRPIVCHQQSGVALKIMKRYPNLFQTPEILGNGAQFGVC